MKLILSAIYLFKAALAWNHGKGGAILGLAIALGWFIYRIVCQIGANRRRKHLRGFYPAFWLAAGVISASCQAQDVEIDFRSTPLRPLAAFYGQLSHKPVIVPTDTPDGEITVASGRKLASGEALELLDGALAANGYRMNCTSNFCTLQPLTDYKPTVLPEISERLTDYVRLKHCFPELAASMLTTNFHGLTVEQDKRQRMLVLTADAETLVAARMKIDELDRPLRTVLVEAIVTEVDVTTNAASGFNIFQRVVNSANGAIAGGSQGSQAGSGQPVNLTAVTPTPANIVGNGTFWLTLKGLKIDALLKLLDSDSNFKVISKPILSVIDGESADLSIGQQRPYITQSVSTSLTGYQVASSGSNGLNQLVGSTVAFIDLTLGLTVKPRIGSDDLIEMVIAQQANDFGGEITLPTGAVPIVNHRSLKTVTQIKSGETILLGGLVRSDDEMNSEGLPGLRKLPVAGKLFGESSHKQTKSELLVFLRATIQEVPE